MPDAASAACLLDVTRLLSRAGRGPLTGIDRVELAWLEVLLARDAPLFGLAQDAGAQVLLDAAGLSALRDRLTGRAEWGPPDLRARLRLRQPAARRRALSDLRRLGLARGSLARMPGIVARHVPAPFVYLNAGHSNLQPRLLSGLQRRAGARVTVLIHDTIPLDHPDLTREGIPQAFEAKLRAVSASAHRILYNSRTTQDAAERHLRGYGRVPEGLVTPLGVERPVPDRDALARARPAGLDPNRPFFVILGTIEPRKNHALLLDIWEVFQRDMPDALIPALCIVGARGWRNEELFRRLDSSPLMGRHIFEMNALSDGAVAALLHDARALLFPSLAEGFGLPAAEAALHGTPVLCSDLAVFREILQEFGTYAAIDDKKLWSQHIFALMGTDKPSRQAAAPQFSTWEEHVHRALGGMT